MKKLLSILVFCTLIFSVSVASDFQAVEVYTQRLQSDWVSAFSEPFEILYLIMYDTSGFGLTTMEEGRINITVTYLVEYLREEGYELSDIAIMLHNHFRIPRLSWEDERRLRELRNRGFRGSFGVYHVPSGKIIFDKTPLKASKNL